MLRTVDDWLNRITMYKLLFYVLIILVIIAMGFSVLGKLNYSSLSIGISTLVLVAVCWLVNKVFALIFNAPTNTESVYITALILALIIAPMPNYHIESFGFLLAAGGLAMASKYILTINKRHIFNPAAIAVVLTALGPEQTASWWIGTTLMLPFVAIGGLLLVRKIRRGQMVATFFVSALLSTVVYNLIGHTDVLSALSKTLLSSAMFFLGFIMLTEPLTTPPTRVKQNWYAVLVGLLFPPQFHIFKQYSTPELALATSNIFSYLVSSKVKLFPGLASKNQLTPNAVEFKFKPERKLNYQAGQYMEWTLPHEGIDSRGDRRYFTLSSSPTEDDITIGVKFYSKSSSYKQSLLKIDSCSTIVASQLAGDFTLPRDKSQKLVFIAGGIGITPFRSMIKFLIDTNDKRDITLLYSVSRRDDIAYEEVFNQAQAKLGIKTVFFITDEQVSGSQITRGGRLTPASIKSEIQDFKSCSYYISGTHNMVVATQSTLKELGVPSYHIKVDYFSGYV